VHTVSTREITDATGDRSSFSSASFTVESPGQPPEPGKLIVNEVQYAPPPGSVEFVELLSLNEEPLSLSYLTLFDAQNTSGPVDTAAPPLSPGQLAVLAADSSLQHVIDSNALFLVPESWPGFTNSGDAVVVRWAGHMIDSLHYTSVGDRSGVSMERVDPRKPTSFRGNWSFSSDRTGSTPGRVNTVYSPDHVPPALVSAEALPSDAVRLTLDEPVQASAAIPGHFRVGSAGAAAVTPEDDREFPSVLRLEFPGAFESTHTRLFAAQVTDLAGNTATSLSVDVAWPPAAGELVINEIMYGPRTDPTDGRPDQPEYLELLNTTVRPLSLSECVWAGEPNEDGSADTASVAGRTPALRPGGYALLVKAADLETAEEALGDAFPGFPPQSAPLIFPISTSSAPSLRNNGDHVALLCRPSVLVDAVTYDSDWQDAGRAEASGVSLERIDPYSASTEPTNWASSLAPSGGTPGMDNSVRPVEAVPAISGDIVINEILYEPSDLGWSPRVDFIELLNRSGRPLDLNGFYVQQRAASQSAGDSTRVAYNPTILEPGGYGLFFAVPPSTPTNAGALSRLFPALDGEPPTAVILGRRRGGFSIPSRRTCLSLMSPAAIEVDYVCYDPGWHHPHLSDTRGISLERIDADNPSTAQNWTSSTDASGATPATRNSVAISGQPGESARPGLTIAPNPFSPDRDGVDDTARIEYRLVSRRALVRVRIYDSLGKRVRTLIPGRASAGSGVTLWDGLDDRQAALPVGIYVVLLDAVDSDSAQTEVYKSALVLARKLG
jgi:hypothetical protein